VADDDSKTILGLDQAQKHLGLGSPGPKDADEAMAVQQFASFLIRTNYVKEVGKLIPLNWAAMSEKQLTAELAKLGEERITKMFMEKSELRQALKNRARSFSMIAACVVALIWIRDDLDQGRYGVAAAKFSATIGGAYALNRYFYGRDKSAVQIMAKHMGNYGRWLQGVARTNRWVNFLAVRLNAVLLLWSVRGLFMSGGLDGPNIPFDFIIPIDLSDKSTWRAPPQWALDLGCDFFYYLKDPNDPRLYSDVCLGVIRGSLLGAPKRLARRIGRIMVSSSEHRDPGRLWRGR